MSTLALFDMHCLFADSRMCVNQWARRIGRCDYAIVCRVCRVRVGGDEAVIVHGLRTHNNDVVVIWIFGSPESIRVQAVTRSTD